MISVEDARARLLDLVSPLPSEVVPLHEANGRVLAAPVQAERDQPPFAASSMDGYAVRALEATQHAKFSVIGEAAAGHRFEGTVNPGQAVRIFTGAPLPDGTDFVVIQEDVTRQGDLITISAPPGQAANVRPAGGDFQRGASVDAPRRLRPQDVALLASMNLGQVPVARKPKVAIVSTGDELVMPGETPAPDQIVASNTFGLAAMLRDIGAAPRVLPIARDSLASLATAFELSAGADLVITIGGASVGDHDLVSTAADAYGIERAFYKVAMRPGKPLMAGKLDQTAMVGLPGNPVSAMVCGRIFVQPMILRMLGLPTDTDRLQQATLAAPIPENGPRQHYMRALVQGGSITAFDRQDSALLTVLAQANALLVRAPHDPARDAGTDVSYLPL